MQAGPPAPEIHLQVPLVQVLHILVHNARRIRGVTLGRGAKTGRTELGEAHLPTGRVALEDFVNLVIEDFNVLPVRDDWKEALQASRAEFAADRSWG